MSATEAIERKVASVQAVEEEYGKLQRFHVNGRRVVFLDDSHAPEGAFGIVRKAELHQSAYLPAWWASRRYGPPQLVAVKQIKLSRISNTPRVKRAFTREVLVWSSLEAHPGIAKFLGFYADFKRSEAWLLSPWEPNGNVSEFIKAHNLEVPEKLSLLCRAQGVYDTADALAFLHQLSPLVCHRDIKSVSRASRTKIRRSLNASPLQANVLVSADYKARLCDFGLALLHEDSGFGRLETSTRNKGSIRWCSPELIDGAPRAPTSDVYAWAWLVWEIMTGNLPYGDTLAEYAIIRQIFESPLPQVDGASRLSDCLQVWDLMMRCWNGDPQQRPTARMCKTTVTYLPRCVPAPEDIEDRTRSAPLLENLGHLESWKGNSEEASAYLDEALRLYQKEGDFKGIANVLAKQAETACSNSDYGQAITTATAALEHFRNLNDPLGIADASLTIGDSLLMEDQLDETLPFLSEALEIYRIQGNDVGAAVCLERIGTLQRAKCQPEDALVTLEEAVAVAFRSGDRLGEARALRGLGSTHFDRGDFDGAAEAFSKALLIAQNIGWYSGLSSIGERMGEIKMQSGDYHGAEALFQDSVSVARQGRSRWDLAWGLDSLGECFQKQSKLDKAASALGEACLLLQELSLLENSAEVASTLVEIKRSQSDWDGALYWHDHIIAVHRIREQHWSFANRLELKARTLVEAQRYDEAALHLEAAVATSTKFGAPGSWISKQISAIPKTIMKWERRLPLLCDLKKLQRRQPHLRTAALKLQIPFNPGAL